MSCFPWNAPRGLAASGCRERVSLTVTVFLSSRGGPEAAATGGQRFRQVEEELRGQGQGRTADLSLFRVPGSPRESIAGDPPESWRRTVARAFPVGVPPGNPGRESPPVRATALVAPMSELITGRPRVAYPGLSSSRRAARSVRSLARLAGGSGDQMNRRRHDRGRCAAEPQGGSGRRCRSIRGGHRLPKRDGH